MSPILNYQSRGGLQPSTLSAFILLIVLTHIAKAVETETVSANLAALSQGGGSLRSTGGEFRFGNFVMDPFPSGSAVPDLSKIVLTADGGSLLWQIGEDRRILRAGDNYLLGIQFQVTALAPQHRLASATLDIAGATTGTTSDASAELMMQLLRNDGGFLGSLSVLEAPTGRQLIDTEDWRGPRQWMAWLQIRADGGSGSAALVLTDVETSFTAELVPEPSGLLLSGICATGLLLVGHGSRRSTRP